MNFPPFSQLTLTKQEHKVWLFVKQFIADNGYSPTTQEIADAIGIQSRGVVYRYLLALSEQGVLTLVANKKRNIQLCENTQDQLYIIGKIAAGQPIEAIEHKEPVDISHVFLGEGRYALKVVGDSMVDEGIFDGDIVVCQQTNQVAEGQIAVVLIDQSWATLKKIYRQNPDEVLLVPANVSYEPQIYHASRVTIQGAFVGLLRIATR